MFIKRLVVLYAGEVEKFNVQIAMGMENFTAGSVVEAVKNILS